MRPPGHSSSPRAHRSRPVLQASGSATRLLQVRFSVRQHQATMLPALSWMHEMPVLLKALRLLPALCQGAARNHMTTMSHHQDSNHIDAPRTKTSLQSGSEFRHDYESQYVSLPAGHTAWSALQDVGCLCRVHAFAKRLQERCRCRGTKEDGKSSTDTSAEVIARSMSSFPDLPSKKT